MSPIRIFRAAAAWTGRRLIPRPLLVECDGRIQSIAPENQAPTPPDAEEIDFGDAIILPGFINAHAHLEYSYLKGRLELGSDFASWLMQLTGASRAVERPAVAAAVDDAIEQSVANGATSIFDVSTCGDAEATLRQRGLRGCVFLESIRLDPDQADAALVELVGRIDYFEKTGRLNVGLSPHTPYTVSAPLGAQIGKLARERNLRLTIHLAETPEERQMLESGAGPLVDLFRQAGFLPKNWKAPGIGPVEWADRAGLLGGETLAVHCNDLTDGEIALLAERRVSVAICPKSHEYFARPTSPLSRLREAGINVCVGTDSLASNDRLDLLEELRTARRQCPGVAASALFDMIGKNAARAVGLGDRLGTLESGADCDLTVVAPAPDLDKGAEVALDCLLDEDRNHAAKSAVVAGETI